MINRTQSLAQPGRQLYTGWRSCIPGQPWLAVCQQLMERVHLTILEHLVWFAANGYLWELKPGS